MQDKSQEHPDNRIDACLTLRIEQDSFGLHAGLTGTGRKL